MGKIEQLKKKLRCEKCQTPYSPTSQPYTRDKCKHQTCAPCVGVGYCSICGTKTTLSVDPFPDDLNSMMNIYESSVAESAKIEESLRDEISLLKQEREKLEMLRIDNHKCSECENTDSEQNMQLCSTCHALKSENIENIKKNALCPTCAIKKHLRKGHQIVDFFPYLSAYNFSSCFPKIKFQSEELKNSRVSLNNTLDNFNDLSTGVLESYDVLTEMARRSESTKSQLEFIEKMETFIEESKSIHIGADSELKERTKMLQENLTKIKDWYNTRMDDRVDGSEIIKLDEITKSIKNDTA